MGSLLFLQFFGKYRTVRKMYSRKPRRANHSWRDVGVKGPPLQGSAHATSPRRGPIRPESTLHPSCPPDQSSLSLLGFGPASLLRFARELSCCNHTPPRRGRGVGAGKLGLGWAPLLRAPPPPGHWFLPVIVLCSAPWPRGHSHQSTGCLTLWCKRSAVLHGAGGSPLWPPSVHGEGQSEVSPRP